MIISLLSPALAHSWRKRLRNNDDCDDDKRIQRGHRHHGRGKVVRHGNNGQKGKNDRDDDCKDGNSGRDVRIVFDDKRGHGNGGDGPKGNGGHKGKDDRDDDRKDGDDGRDKKGKSKGKGKGKKGKKDRDDDR